MERKERFDGIDNMNIHILFFNDTLLIFIFVEKHT
jgi:hypothetical protein